METDLDEIAVRARAAREGLVGKTIAGRYVIRGLLGHGGMGAVYEAEHIGIGKRAAIKFVDPEFATDEKVVARFAREARAMSAIESAHIVTVFDAGSEEGRPYLVMELLRGEDLGQRLRRLRRIPLREAMHIVAQVLKGLARAHAAGIVHRDLKPDNVFLVKHDTDPVFAKIVDFGISKIERPRANTSPLALTGRGTVLGTPFYMSPEQAQASSDVDGRTDLYSVGAILFECLTGRPPHTGESYEQVILSICMRDAPLLSSLDPSISAPVSAFVARALARDKTQRFSSAERMLAALHDVAPEERTRVPLDPVAPETLVSEGVKSLAATVLDGGSGPRSSRPSFEEISAATRLGVGSLDAQGVDASGDGEPVAKPAAKPRADAKLVNTPLRASAKTPAKDVPKAAASPSARAGADPNGGRAPAKSSPQSSGKRPIGTALVTAMAATLTGVAVTFGVISALDKKNSADNPPLVTSSTANASAHREGPRPSAETATSSANLANSAAASALASASASAVPASSSSTSPTSSTSSGKAATPLPPRPTGTTASPPPRASSTKPLDIQRDLP